jgi:hypothetical protein
MQNVCDMKKKWQPARVRASDGAHGKRRQLISFNVFL